jgi:hypothetical protein
MANTTDCYTALVLFPLVWCFSWHSGWIFSFCGACTPVLLACSGRTRVSPPSPSSTYPLFLCDSYFLGGRKQNQTDCTRSPIFVEQLKASHPRRAQGFLIFLPILITNWCWGFNRELRFTLGPFLWIRYSRADQNFQLWLLPFIFFTRSAQDGYVSDHRVLCQELTLLFIYLLLLGWCVSCRCFSTSGTTSQSCGPSSCCSGSTRAARHTSLLATSAASSPRFSIAALPSALLAVAESQACEQII